MRHNSERYVQTLKVKQRIRRVRPNRKINPLHSAYSPGLASSGFRLFWPHEGCIPTTPLADDDYLKDGVRQSWGTAAKSFLRPAYTISNKDGKSVLIMKESLWKNNPNFGKDVPMIYVNFIYSFLGKTRRH
jgi:hypothetical protein